MRRADGIRNPRVNHIVSVDEEHGRLRIDLGIVLERNEFIRKEHNPTVRHRSRDGNAELLPRRDRCRHVDAANVCCTRPIGRRIHVVCTPRTKIRNTPPLCRTHNA